MLWLGPAAATGSHQHQRLHNEKRSFSCSSLASGLNSADCSYMSSIGMYGQGTNAVSNNGAVWIGDDGANTFTFTNDATSPSDVGVILILWEATSYESSFVTAVAPAISYSLPNVGDSVTISVANSISGAWAALNNHATVLSEYGQIYNTWGEFTTGDYATVDVSREVNMSGNNMTITVQDTGCVSDMDTCVFICNSGTTCGDSGTYSLENCAAGSQDGASYGTYDGNPSGGCTGFSDGGHLDILLQRY